jgi:hypothetical protein
MNNYLIIAKIIVATSVAYVWIFRYDVIVKEFKEFGLSELTRAFVGASKVALATLLVAGIWYPSFIPVSSTLMALFMVAAQYYHFKIKNTFIKHLPSLILLILCALIALGSIGVI